MGIGDDRPHFVLFFSAHTARPNLQGFHQRLQARNQFIRRFITHGDHHRQRHAALARRAERAAHNGIHGGIKIGIRHHNRVVFRRAKRLYPLAISAGGFINMLRHAGRSDKAYRRDPRVPV